ncbi:hypothetical protein [Breoghania sp. L-A4]|uniref:hypothetical protein n=1 Tax=Breoghania sp. L-A4 TaxID=2304600 RepID=UPI000E35BDB2|nr:hypothetical protein [Breoghania sp. L-A4]AXS39998.1 hypothetical protein D1F64_07900 [Breoghania sp. L-A4]
MTRTLSQLVLVTLFAVPLAAAPALAARPDVRRMTCAQAHDMVLDRGAVVMTTGRFTYERFVSHQRYCDRWETVVPALAATRDKPQCLVGYICEEPLFRGFGD